MIEFDVVQPYVYNQAKYTTSTFLYEMCTPTRSLSAEFGLASGIILIEYVLPL